MIGRSTKTSPTEGFHIETLGINLDLVCGMEFKDSLPNHRILYKGDVYYFCSENCKHHFEADPEKYAD